MSHNKSKRPFGDVVALSLFPKGQEQTRLGVSYIPIRAKTGKYFEESPSNPWSFWRANCPHQGLINEKTKKSLVYPYGRE